MIGEFAPTDILCSTKIAGELKGLSNSGIVSLKVYNFQLQLESFKGELPAPAYMLNQRAVQGRFTQYLLATK